MATGYGRKRGNSYGYNRRRGGRRGYSRYGKARASSGKKKSTMSMQKIKKQLETLSLAQHGQPRKYALSGDPGLLRMRPYTGKNYYFAVPISEILRAACGSAGTQSLWVTGISLEGDLYHASSMDWFAACVAVSSGDLPTVELGGDGVHFPLARLCMDEKATPDLWDSDEMYVQSVYRAGFTEPARDGSLFHAPMRTGISPRGNVSFNGSKKTTAHTGRASASFNRKGDMTSGMLTDNYVKDTFRVWWAINKKLTVCDSRGEFVGDRYTVLCGVRPQVDEGLVVDPKAGSKLKLNSVGYLKDIRVVVYARQ